MCSYHGNGCYPRLWQGYRESRDVLHSEAGFTSTKEVVFVLTQLLDCQQNYMETAEQISTKLGWRIALSTE